MENRAGALCKVFGTLENIVGGLITAPGTLSNIVGGLITTTVKRVVWVIREGGLCELEDLDAQCPKDLTGSKMQEKFVLDTEANIPNQPIHLNNSLSHYK